MSDATAQLGDASSTSSPTHPGSSTAATTITGKPVFLRVKRKASQLPIDAFCGEKFGTKKLLLQHFETVICSEDIKDVLNSYLDSGNSKEFKNSEEHRSFIKHEKQKYDERRSAATKEHEKLVKNARFKQIWKRRRKTNGTEESFKEICRLYDVVRVDSDSESSEEPYSDVAADNVSAILYNYLPLIREYIPQAAAEIESLKPREENFVYDVYTVDAGLSTVFEDVTGYPLVQVDDDYYFYDGASPSEYGTDDSNAEDNPRNDYPEEESSGDEDLENVDLYDDLEGSDSHYENNVVDADEEDEQDYR